MANYQRLSRFPLGAIQAEGFLKDQLLLGKDGMAGHLPELEPGMIADMQSTAQRAQLAELLKYATIIISSLPLIVMYPFFQKYFDAGVFAGSVKG